MSIQNTVTVDDLMSNFKAFNDNHQMVSVRDALEMALKNRVTNAMATNGKAQVTFVIDIEPEQDGLINIFTSVQSKDPKPSKGKRFVYADARGRLYSDDPKSMPTTAEVKALAASM